jgi:hypothetical protein
MQSASFLRLTHGSRPLGGRHAAVIPALPDEYENILPIGALQYQDKQRTDPPPDPSRGLSYYPQHIIQQAQQERQQQEQRRQSQQVCPPPYEPGDTNGFYLSNSKITSSPPTTPRETNAQRRGVSNLFCTSGRRLSIAYQKPATASHLSLMSIFFRLHPAFLLLVRFIVVSSASDHLLQTYHQGHLGRLRVIFIVVGLQVVRLMQTLYILQSCISNVKHFSFLSLCLNNF